MHGMVAIADRAQTIPFTPAPRARGQREHSGWSRSFYGNPSEKRPFQRPSPSQQSLSGSCSRDPVGYQDGVSLYEYVGSQPTVGVDSTGTSRTSPGSEPRTPGTGGIAPRVKVPCSSLATTTAQAWCAVYGGIKNGPTCYKTPYPGVQVIEVTCNAHTCDIGLHKHYETLKTYYCKFAPRDCLSIRCNDMFACWKIGHRIKNSKRCLRIRKDQTRDCFGGVENSGHEVARIDAERTLENCKAKHQECCVCDSDPYEGSGPGWM
jgi:hypothetical protein